MMALKTIVGWTLSCALDEPDTDVVPDTLWVWAPPELVFSVENPL